MLAELTLIKKVEKTNIVVVYLQQQIGFVPKYDSYAMNIDCGRNCYNYGQFEYYLIRNCRNYEIMKQERRKRI